MLPAQLRAGEVALSMQEDAAELLASPEGQRAACQPLGHKPSSWSSHQSQFLSMEPDISISLLSGLQRLLVWVGFGLHILLSGVILHNPDFWNLSPTVSALQMVYLPQGLLTANSRLLTANISHLRNCVIRKQPRTLSQAPVCTRALSQEQCARLVHRLTGC